MTPPLTDLEQLRKDVHDADGGVLLTNGQRLREVAGITRLKEKARQRVQEALGGAGLRALPGVPQYQHEEVYIVQTSTTPELLFAALHHPNKDALKRHVLPAIKGPKAALVSRVAVSELSDLLDEAKERLAEIEDGKSRE
jgi:hypothetical protein